MRALNEKQAGVEAGNGEEDIDFEALLAKELAREEDDFERRSDGPGDEGEENDVEKEEGAVNPDEIIIDDEEEEFEEVLPVASSSRAKTSSTNNAAPQLNPEEIRMDEDDFDDPETTNGQSSCTAVHIPPSSIPRNGAPNPDEIRLDDDEFDDRPSTGIIMNSVNAEAGPSKPRKDAVLDESVDLVETVRAEEGSGAMKGVIGVTENEARNTIESSTGSNPSGRRTMFLALDKCGPGKDFIQVSPFSTLQVPSTIPT